MEIFYGRYLSRLLCSLGPGTLSNGLCTGGAAAVHGAERHRARPRLFTPPREGHPPCRRSAERRLTGMCPPSLFNSFCSIASALAAPLSADSAAPSRSPQITVFIYEGGENQYNTKQWLIGLRARCAERSRLYIMYGGQANGQCACRQMDCKHLPCVIIALETRTHTQTHYTGAYTQPERTVIKYFSTYV